MEKKGTTIKLGNRVFDTKGVFNGSGRKLLGEWSSLEGVSLRLGKRMGSLGYWLALDFYKQDTLLIWSASGVKNLLVLADLLKFICSQRRPSLLCDECHAILKVVENCGLGCLKKGNTNEADLINSARIYLAALSLSKAVKVCKKLYQASSNIQCEARHIEIKALLICRKFGKAWRRLKASKKEFPQEYGALVDFTYATLCSGKRFAERLALDLLERKIDGSVPIAIKLAEIYLHRRACKQGLVVLNELGNWPHRKTNDEVEQIASLRNELINTIEYDENVSGLLLKRSVFSRLPTLICLVILGGWFALPAIKEMPEIFRDASEKVKLETWGARSKEVIIKSTLKTSQPGLTRVYYHFATGFTENAQGRVVPAAWKSGSSLMTANQVERILADPESQYVYYDPSNVLKNEMGPVTLWRLVKIYAPRVLQAKVEYGALLIVLFLILLPFAILLGSTSKSLYISLSSSWGPKPKQLHV